MTRSPLIQALIDKHHYVLVTEQNIDSFLQSHDEVVLFFTENPNHFPESNDVAVILPEIVKQYQQRLTVAVVDEQSERALQKRYAFNKWPALVFLRRGEYLGAITGMQNWSDFTGEFQRLLAATPGKASALTLPLVIDSTSGCH
jgi:hydrogenase-1 operon protein HyaE